MKALYMDYGFYIWILKCDMVWNGAGISCVLWIISKEKLYTTEFDLFGCGPWKSGPRPSCFSANRGTVTILSDEYVNGSRFLVIEVVSRQIEVKQPF